MATFLFDRIVFGPVKSRRLGVSLGINLLPVKRKICSFDCIYCECGLNQDGEKEGGLPDRQVVEKLLHQKLGEMVQAGELPDVITFAGNGEPTLHPQFEGIIDDTIRLRNLYCPDARIAVLSNATRIGKQEVVRALLKVDDNILKLDSGLEKTIRLIDRPTGSFRLEETVRWMEELKGQLIIQTMLVRGEYNGIRIDNTSEEDLIPWLDLIQRIRPQKVMLYTIERDTPFNTLQKVSVADMKKIADKVERIGIPVQISG